jgi:acetylornithine deacetylase/succinyl-diaminopimelate desuccinylase-like protein
MEYGSIRALSPAFDPSWEENGELDKAIELLSSWATRRQIPGLEVRVSRLAGYSPALLLVIPGKGPGNALIYGHLDKQPADTVWSKTDDPFSPVRVGDLVYGRGLADDGYSLFVALNAIEALEEEGASYPRTVVLIESAEESGSPGLEEHLRANANEIGLPDLVVCLDSGGADYQRLWVTSSLRGIVDLRLRVEVLKEGVHSGLAGGVVPSSFLILRELLARLEDESTGELKPELFNPPFPKDVVDQAKALVETVGDFTVSDLPLIDGLEPLGRNPVDRVLANTWKSSIAYTGILGMPSIESAGNVMRPFTEIKLAIRIPPSLDPVEASSVLTRLLEADPPHGSKVKATVEADGAGWIAPRRAGWLEDALLEASMEGFGNPHASIGVGGSIPFLAMLGSMYPSAQFVATGVLGPGSNAHGPDESLHIPAAKSVALAVAKSLMALCHAK